MIKGGFQGLDISGVDLTAQSPSLPGAYAACAAADGKPIRVLTADGAVQCSVKKVSTNYVLAGVTGDGKILSITVGSTDGISVSETEIPSGEEANFFPDYGNKVDLTTYSNTNRYTVPCDGYVYCITGSSNNSAGDEARIGIQTKDGSGTRFIFIYARYTSAGDTTSALFVKKGAQLYGNTSGTGTGTKLASFVPLLEV